MATVDGLRGSKYQRGGIWWVKFYQFGRPIRESTKSSEEREADKLLLKRTAAIEEGRTINPKVNKCKIDALFDMVVTDYRVKKRKTLKDTEGRIKNHLKPFFGGRTAISITTDLITKFIEKRQNETYRGKPTGNATINRELAILSKAYTLGREAKKIDDAPTIDTLDENNVRTGFFARTELEAVVAHLTPEVADAVRFAYITGWRIRSEVLKLEWRQVDWRTRTVRLDVGQTKNKEGRVFSFTSELEEVLRSREAETRALQLEQGRICPWVFHRKGERFKSFYKQWRSACVAVGLGHLDPKTKRKHAHRIPHDFRRVAVTNLVNTGTSEGVAMQMTGHKTRSVFDRYHIVRPGDVERAAAELDKLLTAERAAVASGHNLGTVAKLPKSSER
jgi:integrase